MFGLILFVLSLQEVTLTTRIDSVLVTPNGAVISRHAAVKVEKGDYEMVIPDLPPDLDDNTVRVTASNGLRITDVFVTEEKSRIHQKEVEKLRKQIDSLDAVIGSLNDELSVLGVQESLLVLNTRITKLGVTSELMKASIDTGKWRASLRFIGKHLSDILENKRRLKVRLKEIQALRDSVSAKLKQIASSLGVRKAIHVVVHAPESGKYALSASYRVRSVSWKPEYELRARSDGDSITVVYFASINQKTGETWKDVHLTISTAVQPDFVQQPQFVPQYLHTWRSIRGGAPMATEMAEQPALKAAPAPAAPPQVKRTELFSTFSLAGRVTIPSGNWHRIRLDSYSLPCRFQRYAYTFASSSVFLVAMTQNRSKYPMLPGQASLFLDNSFVRKVSLPMVPVGDSLSIAYGIDPGFKVEKKLVKRFRKETWDNKIRIEYHYEITLRNLHGKPLDLTVIDRVPVSQDKQLKIKVMEMEPEPSKFDRNSGKVEWNVRAEPSKTYKIRFGYAVEYPKGLVVRGLD